ncbi:host attachment protein [Sneathiella chinensis]|uniref:Host attachment protein n=1 Tax=Sneathiella chinensis TaxID=349750 RepID=A0ABQ5U6B0_9PROT|nr:host attachment protein [Sneathiella chinensis]GLQ06852.1 hypothetical protein GCM10007924_20730 [Sneathiella chinensis]
MMTLSGRIANEGLKPFIEAKHAVDGYALPKTWVVATNSEQAHFFRTGTPHLEKIGEACPVSEPEAEITNATAGRMPNPFGGGGRHRFEAHDNAMRHGEDAFMLALADYLNEAVEAQAFDRLILIAAPKTLGLLRPKLSKEVNASLTAELDKDLVHLNERELSDYLDKAM